MINVKILDKMYSYNDNILLKDIAKDFKNLYKHPIILAKVNGIYKELSEKVPNNSSIEFFNLTSDKYANNVYLNGLVFLTLYSYKKLFPNDDLIVRHSLDKGLYIETTNKINNNDIDNINKKMKEIVSKDLEIKKITVSRIDAINYFNSIKYHVKANLTNYTTSTFITLLSLFLD